MYSDQGSVLGWLATESVSAECAMDVSPKQSCLWDVDDSLPEMARLD